MSHELVDRRKPAEVAAPKAADYKFNLWEITQSVIAFAITGAIIYASLTDKNVTVLGTSFTLIIALYFVGVNKHER